MNNIDFYVDYNFDIGNVIIPTVCIESAENKNFKIQLDFRFSDEHERLVRAKEDRELSSKNHIYNVRCTHVSILNENGIWHPASENDFIFDLDNMYFVECMFDCEQHRISLQIRNLNKILNIAISNGGIGQYMNPGFRDNTDEYIISSFIEQANGLETEPFDSIDWNSTLFSDITDDIILKEFDETNLQTDDERGLDGLFRAIDSSFYLIENQYA